jgi:hypothetical protein
MTELFAVDQDCLDEFSEILDVALCDEEGLVAFLRGYIDESGIHDGAEITNVALVVSAPWRWRKWTKRWNFKKKPIQIYHSTDSANLRGEFKGWTKEGRDKLVADLLPEIGSMEYMAWVVGADNRDIAVISDEYPKFSEAVGSPYSFCLQIAIQKCLLYLDGAESTEMLALIHEQNDYHQDALRAFEWIRGPSSIHAPRDMTLTFASKKRAPPLQAADVFAYEGNKRMRNIGRTERRAWRAINPDRNKVQLDYFDMAGLREWIALLEKAGVSLR